MRIHHWTADAMGSGWYRGYLPAVGLSWLGHQTSVGPKYPGDDDTIETVIGCRVAKPGAVALWRKLKGQGKRLVLDLDDDYLGLDRANAQAYALWTHSKMRSGLLEAISVADTVTVCSERLVEIFGKLHPDVRLIPNGLPAQYLAIPRDYDPKTLTVGWAGTSSTVAELHLAARHLSRIADYKGGSAPVLTRLIGADPETVHRAGMRGVRIGVMDFIPRPEQYLQAVQEFDIWVAPYRDIGFNRAKFATKALEAGFLGIPLIASAIEPYESAVEHGATGLLVPPGHEHLFGRYLKQLVDDPDLRQRMGLAARAKASSSILQSLNKTWEAVIQS